MYIGVYPTGKGTQTFLDGNFAREKGWEGLGFYVVVYYLSTSVREEVCEPFFVICV